MKEEVDATVFLLHYSNISIMTLWLSLSIIYDWGRAKEKGKREERNTFPAKAMHLEVRYSEPETLVVNMPNLASEMKSTRSSIFWGKGGSSRLLAL